MTPHLLKTRLVSIGAVMAAALAPGLIGTPPAAAASAPSAALWAASGPVPRGPDVGAPGVGDAVAEPDRDRLLSPAWRGSADLAWTTSGDARGFHLLVAEARQGYAWRTVATLSEPGIPTDQWIGNACLTGSGRRAVLVYAPRHFSNRDHLFGRGGFAAVVDLATGAVTKLDVGASLAYYDPGCGVGETAVLTQSAAIESGRTRLHLLDAARGTVTRRHELPGQVTSAVPVGAGIVAASGAKLIDVAADGRQRALAVTRGVPFEVHPDAAGGVTFLDQPDGSTAAVNSLSGGRMRELGRGRLSEVGLVAGTGGRTFVTGEVPALADPPAGMRRLEVDAHAGVSSHGGLAVLRKGPLASAGAADPADPAGGPAPVNLQATVTATGRSVEFRAPVGMRPPEPSAAGAAPSPVLSAPLPTGTGGVRALAAASPTDPVDADATCAVPRNDPRTQVEQPHWRQVEWAADLAVAGNLTIQRPTNWNGSGLSAWSPQGMYPRIGLTGSGGRVPAAVMLGILAQESNLWQASWHVLEGQTGNPLVGSYYGVRSGWAIDWANADCGYGVAQVTDGMRRAGKQRPGEAVRPANEQRAIAVDYATNIAAGLRILESKWNQVYPFARINGGDPAKIENWFAAVWAYNSGVNPQAVTGNTSGCTPGPSCTDDRGNWGLGWGNNPANPDYPYNRRPFLNGVSGEGSPADAATPNLWPYPEKVMGWAAFPIVKSDFRTPGTYEAGYLQAWWVDNLQRTAVKPPLATFCSVAAATDNNCRVSASGQGSCGYADYHCWWHWHANWKPNCQSTDTGGNVVYTCGYDNVRYSAGSPEPADGTHYPPVCSTAGLPPGSLIVDDQPDTVPPVRSGCSKPTTNSGDFALRFAGTSAGLFPSKMDLHQVGGGLDAHFWFAHTFTPTLAATNTSTVTGTWTLTDRWWANKWARVLVHLPGHGAHTQQADYVVDTGSGPAATRYRHRIINTKSRYKNADDRGDRWVSLGVFNFTGTPAVSLSNVTRDGGGTQDIAFDAVAFQPLPAKPRNIVVALGDSYSSGEGASQDHTVDYYRETDADGTDPVNRNGCHRSRHAWIRKAVLADRLDTTLGARADGWDDNLDLQFIACSWAETENLLPAAGPPDAWGDYGHSPVSSSEVTQLDAGYLDENTTLVTLSIGGNDARFGPVLAHCVQNDPAVDCQNDRLGSDPEVLSVTVPQLIRTKVKDSISTTLSEIHRKAPNAKVVLVGYPKLIDNVNCLQGPTVPPARIYVTAAEAAWMNSMADVLATAMQEAATVHAAYTRFADPRPDFAAVGVCALQNEAIHGIVTGQTPGEIPMVPPRFAAWGPSAQSFHPKIAGTTRYAATVNRTLRAMGP